MFIRPTAGRQAVDTTTALYEDARQSRLGTDKFMIDGRHVGTGGGNHVVLGGATPSDSPFLRRPDLLRSLILYWQRHPSLSYLFSGLFIGPTSQAPRIDEARHDSLYELEIAMAQVPDAGAGYMPAWLVDRLFRNLLDRRHRQHPSRRNLHRQALLAGRPDRSARPGRVSLVRNAAGRAHVAGAAIAAARADRLVLARAAARRSWCAGAPRCTIASCCRTSSGRISSTCSTISIAPAIRSKASGSRRSASFAFRSTATVEYSGVKLELRQALEPWHVLGEESAAGGTVRFVDSSVERLQVKAAGFVPARHVITCNGRKLPMTLDRDARRSRRRRALQGLDAGRGPASDDAGACAADLRCRRPAGIGRSLGGCVYHVAHPGGRNYETFPVNSYEAEARRLARFQDHGHTGGLIDSPRDEAAREFPLTLDLRRPATW